MLRWLFKTIFKSPALHPFGIGNDSISKTNGTLFNSIDITFEIYLPVHTLFLGFEIIQIHREFFLFWANEYLAQAYKKYRNFQKIIL